MSVDTAPDEVLTQLRLKGGRMLLEDFMCSFTSGEEPSANLWFIIDGGVLTLLTLGKVRRDGKFLQVV